MVKPHLTKGKAAFRRLRSQQASRVPGAAVARVYSGGAARATKPSNHGKSVGGALLAGGFQRLDAGFERLVSSRQAGHFLDRLEILTLNMSSSRKMRSAWRGTGVEFPPHLARPRRHRSSGAQARRKRDAGLGHGLPRYSGMAIRSSAARGGMPLAAGAKHGSQCAFTYPFPLSTRCWCISDPCHPLVRAGYIAGILLGWVMPRMIR